MNLLAQIFHRTPEPHPHVVIRHVVATRTESKAAQRRKEATTAALRTYVRDQILVAAVAQAISPSIVSKETGE